MVSGHPKSAGISRVNELSTGPPGFGVSQCKPHIKFLGHAQVYVHLISA